MIYFFSDLDRTLIYSRRIALNEKKIVVELLKGREQSYMTEKTYNFFASTTSIKLVPVTSRTEEQYSRVANTFSNINCDLALICNGSVLLENGLISPAWSQESLALAEDEITAFHRALQFAIESYFAENIVDTGNLLFYIKTSDPIETEQSLKAHSDLSKVLIYHDNRKVYCCPRSNNKGTALRRLAKKLGVDNTIAAGDGIQDVPMLNAARYAIVPSSLNSSISNPLKSVMTGPGCFSDFICDELKRKPQQQ